jgi:hypothetical protein
LYLQDENVSSQMTRTAGKVQERVAAWNASYGAVPLVDAPLTLMLPIATIAKAGTVLSGRLAARGGQTSFPESGNPLS